MTGEPAVQIDEVLDAFRGGDPILVHDYDERENEVDLIFPASAVTPEDVVRMRTDAGGLICVALLSGVCDMFELPYIRDVVNHPASKNDPAYDSSSSFSLTVNHKDTYTGITDSGRATTIDALARAASAPDNLDFSAEFRVPGHVPILRGAPGLLEQRQGHTELGLALAREANITPAVVVCEMLDSQTYDSLSAERAKTYAAETELVYVEGSSVFEELC